MIRLRWKLGRVWGVLTDLLITCIGPIRVIECCREGVWKRYAISASSTSQSCAQPNNRQPHSVRTLDDLRDAASVNRVVISRSNVISVFPSVNDI